MDINPTEKGGRSMKYEKPEINVYDAEALRRIEAHAASCCPTGKVNS